MSDTNAEKSRPSHLYKYESFNTRSLENLKSQILYFGSPLHFNDPYDCALIPNIRAPSNQEIEEIRTKLLRYTTKQPKTLRDLEGASVEDLKPRIIQAGHNAFDRVSKSFLESRGVTCFSECNDNLLMWSHYGGHFKGFCLEFSTDLAPFDRVRQVRYRDEIPSIDLATLLVSDDNDDVIDLFCTKAAAWKYEAEWRCIHAHAGTKYCYEANCLTGVYFGPDISAESLEIICLILSGQNESVKLWRGQRSSTEFKVVFEKFTYKSHLEAKRIGR
jgi:hypothetical protein